MEEKNILKQFIFRNIEREETGQAIAIERICFPPHEACSAEAMTERIIAAPDLFLVAVDNNTGKIAGFFNGVATDEASFRDAFFTDITLHRTTGKNIMLLGLDVLPEYRGRGLAKELVERYAERERSRGRESLVLTCLADKVEMYEKMGFTDRGIADSTWGNEQWHEMRYAIESSMKRE